LRFPKAEPLVRIFKGETLKLSKIKILIPSVYISLTEGLLNLKGVYKLNTEYNFRNSSNSERLYYLDFLRIISTFAVIMIHFTTRDINLATANKSAYMFFNSLSHFCVPVFAMISGSLFLNKSKNTEISALMKRVFHMSVVYVFWLLFYSVSFYLYKKEFDFYAGYHLWFLPMIIGLYIVTPLLKKITSDRKTSKYFLIIFFITSIILDNLSEISYFKENYFLVDTLSHINFGLGTIKYPLYFVLGHYISLYNIDKKKEYAIYILGIISSVCLTVFSIFFSENNDFPIGDYFSVFVFIQSLAIFMFFKNRFRQFSPDKKITNIIKITSDCTFGIYLVHLMVLSLMEHIGFVNLLSINKFINPIMFTVIAFIISFAVSFIISKIPFVNKYII